MFFVSILFVSCEQDSLVAVNNAATKTTDSNNILPRVIFSNKDDVSSTLNLLDHGNNLSFVSTRASQNKMDPVNNEKYPGPINIPKTFVSLYDVEENKFMSSLTQEQRDSVKNDTDELEYCCQDSLIPDEDLANIVNANRELQVADTVYKFVKGGLLFANVAKQKQLELIDPYSPKLGKSSTKLPTSFDGVTYMPVEHAEGIPDENNTSYQSSSTPSTMPSTTSPATSADLHFKDGTVIPGNRVRVIDFDNDNDEGRLKRLWTDRFGKNKYVEAIKKINKHKKLILELSYQNYYVYARIKTDIRMQKKCVGIWWKCKSNGMKLGWNAVELVTNFKADVYKIFEDHLGQMSSISNNILPDRYFKNFPFEGDITLLSFPFSKYNFTGETANRFLTKNLDNFIGSRITAFVNNKWEDAQTAVRKKCMEEINNGKYGLYTWDGPHMYSLFGPHEESNDSHCKSLTKDFWNKKFPIFNEFEVGLDYNLGTGRCNLVNFKLSGKPNISLGKAEVYGGVNYKGTWYGAIIFKNSH